MVVFVLKFENFVKEYFHDPIIMIEIGCQFNSIGNTSHILRYFKRMGRSVTKGGPAAITPPSQVARGCGNTPP